MKFEEYLNRNAGFICSRKIEKYELKADSVNKLSKPIFNFYDKNNDGTLQKEEILELKKDIEKYMEIDGDENNFTESEAKSLLNKILPNKKANIKALNEMFSSLIYNYLNNNTVNNTVADGKIGDIEQGDSGDCWLLSGLRGLYNTGWGKKAIKESIIKDKNESYTIKLSGVNFETQITKGDIKNAKASVKYSDGDLDVLLIELAAERYLQQESDKGNFIRYKDVLEGISGACSGPLTIQYMLTGKQGHSFCLSKITREEHRKNVEEACTNQKFKSDIKLIQHTISNAYDIETMKNLLYKIVNLKEDVSIQCAFKAPDQWENSEIYKAQDEDLDFENSSAHCFNIDKIVTDENGNIIDIVLTNPWDTEIEIHKTLDEFLDKISGVYLTRESDNYDDLTENFLPCVVTVE